MDSVQKAVACQSRANALILQDSSSTTSGYALERVLEKRETSMSLWIVVAVVRMSPQDDCCCTITRELAEVPVPTLSGLRSRDSLSVPSSLSCNFNESQYSIKSPHLRHYSKQPETKMVRGPEIPLWKRHLIIGLYLIKKERYIEIGKDLDLPPNTVEHIIRRAKARCAEDPDIGDLMRAVAVQSRSGRPKRAAPDSNPSRRPKSGRSKRKTATSDASLTIGETLQQENTENEFDTQPTDQAGNSQLQYRQDWEELDPNFQSIREHTS